VCSWVCCPACSAATKSSTSAPARKSHKFASTSEASGSPASAATSFADRCCFRNPATYAAADAFAAAAAAALSPCSAGGSVAAAAARAAAAAASMARRACVEGSGSLAPWELTRPESRGKAASAARRHATCTGARAGK
jgi:hypothetical protein